MGEIIHTRLSEAEVQYKKEHDGYEYYKRSLVPRGGGEQCMASVYEIPPGKAAYPYHYHTKNEEVFYIMSGSGILKTPEGERPVSAGEMLFFPAEEKGAHKLTNSSATEYLVYLDFDTYNDIDVAFYPDSGKVAIWGKNIDQVYKTEDEVDYYAGE